MSEFVKNEKTKSTFISTIIISVVFVILTLFVIFLTRFWISVSIVLGNSMNPTLQEGDALITNRLAQAQRGDVVVVKVNENTDYIKRVIAVEGDTIFNDENGKLFIIYCNETEAVILEENYIYSDAKTYDSDGLFNYVIPEGHVFVLGDNRKNSTDSRVLGPIESDKIKGVISNFWIKNKKATTKIFS